MDTPSHSLAYRPELDGLRAIAALVVIVFHAKLTLGGVELLPGGYLAVDLFFVLSGFLIGRVIWNELKAGRFSFPNFFERRIRRLVPALLFVVATILLLAKLFLTPSQSDLAHENLASVLLFFSNFNFALEDPYFAAESLQRPFLHSWSLAIEEQFYLIIPFVLLALSRFRFALILSVLFGLGIASLFAAQWASLNYPQLAFYLLPFRFWELLAGVLLAVWLQQRPSDLPGVRAAEPISALALLILVASFMLFDSDTAHPSFSTLIPVIASCALIWAVSSSKVAQSLLSLPPLTFVGRLSYTLYLWHFALFALWRISHDGELNWSAFWLLSFASLILSVLSFYLLERPVRVRIYSGVKRHIDIPLMVIIGAGIFFISRGGQFTPEKQTSIEQVIAEAKRRPPEMNGKRCRDRTPETSCRYIMSIDAPELILMGDSHAEALATALIPAAREAGYNLTLLLEGGCPLWPNVTRSDYPTHRQESCLNQARDFALYIEANPQADIIYFAHLSAYLGYGGYSSETSNLINVDALIEVRSAENNSEAAFQNSLKEFGQTLDNDSRKIYLIHPVPWWNENPVTFIQDNVEQEVVSESGLMEALPKLPLSESLIKSIKAQTALVTIGQRSEFQHIYPIELYCDLRAELCYSGDDRGLYYADDNHLSPYGAEILASYLIEKLGPAHSQNE